MHRLSIRFGSMSRARSPGPAGSRSGPCSATRAARPGRRTRRRSWPCAGRAPTSSRCRSASRPSGRRTSWRRTAAGSAKRAGPSPSTGPAGHPTRGRGRGATRDDLGSPHAASGSANTCACAGPKRFSTEPRPGLALARPLRWCVLTPGRTLTVPCPTGAAPGMSGDQREAPDARPLPPPTPACPSAGARPALGPDLVLGLDGLAGSAAHASGSSMTDRMLPAGSLNQAMRGPLSPPPAIPRASVAASGVS